MCSRAISVFLFASQALLLLAISASASRANGDSGKQAFCEAVRNPIGLVGLVNCTHTSFPQALKSYMNFCKANISGNVTYETHFLSLCEVEGYDQQVQSCMAQRMEDLGRVIRIPENEITAYTGCINAVERRVHELTSGQQGANELQGEEGGRSRAKRALGASWAASMLSPGRRLRRQPLLTARHLQ